MSSVQMRLDGDTKLLLYKLKKMSNLNIRGVLKSVGEGLRTSTVERFREERTPEGTKWKSSIRAMKDGGKTLTETAILRNSIRSKASDTGLAVGTNDIRAASHQFGDERTIRAKKSKYLRFKINGSWVNVKSVKINIPARPFLGMSDDDMQDVKEVLEIAISKE